MNQDSFFPYVAELGEELVGFGTIFIFQRIRGGRVGLIEDMVVKRELRNSGIGTLLLENLLTKAWELDCHKVSLQASPNSERFYQATGFHLAGKLFQIEKPRA